MARVVLHTTKGGSNKQKAVAANRFMITMNKGRRNYTLGFQATS